MAGHYKDVISFSRYETINRLRCRNIVTWNKYCFFSLIFKAAIQERDVIFWLWILCLF